MKAEEIRCGHFIPIDPNKVPWPAWAAAKIEKHMEDRMFGNENTSDLKDAEKALIEWAKTATTGEIERMSSKTGLDLKDLKK